MQSFVAAAKPARVIVAGGIAAPGDLATLDRIGADAQIGTALHQGKLTLADAIIALLRSDRPDGLFSTMVWNR